MDKSKVNEEYLAAIYYDLSKEGSFAGIEQFYKVAKKDQLHLTLYQVKQWLQRQERYEVHYPFRQKIQRSRICVAGLDYMWEMDLMDLSSLARYNKGIRYVLLVIDAFSRYVWTHPLKS